MVEMTNSINKIRFSGNRPGLESEFYIRLQEPYEKIPCNQLRRECYRRKLRVVKKGQYANSTKKGFIQLLRDDDKDTVSTSKQPIPTAKVVELYMKNLQDTNIELTDCTITSSKITNTNYIPLNETEQEERYNKMESVKYYNIDYPNSKAMVSTIDESSTNHELTPSHHHLINTNHTKDNNKHLNYSLSSQQIVQYGNSINPNHMRNSQLQQLKWERLYTRYCIINENLKSQTIHSNDMRFYQAMKEKLQHNLLLCIDEY